jgi:hypothetical protein
MKIKTNNTNKKKIIIISSTIFVVLAIFSGVLLYRQSTTKEAASPVLPMTTSSNKSSTTTESSTTETKTDGTTSQGGSITSTKADASITPAVPTGTFVSNHRPNLSGSPAPNVVSSTCITTPGVQCKLSFTKGTTVLSLDIKTTDSNGNASWEWNVNTPGLTVGDWTVTATAINGTKTATATDSMKLSVSE